MRVILLVAIAFGLTLGGCRKRPEAPPEPVRVLATTQAMADIAKTIGGEYVTVEWYVESGQSLAELIETPERRASYRQAELVVTRGASDGWTLEGYGNTYQDRKIVRLDTLLAARDNDPALYLWLDPEAAIDLSQTIAERLSVLEPRGSATYKANADKFRQSVAELMEKATVSINRSGGGAFLTLDRGFLPLARRFGMHEVRAPSISLVEPTNYNVKILKQAATDAGAGAIFANSELPAPLLRDWESRLGMPVLSLDALGTSSPTGRHTYLEMLRYNLDQLATGAARNSPTTRSNQLVGEQTGEVKPEYPRGREAVDEKVEGEQTGSSRRGAVSPSNPFTPETRATPKVELPNLNAPSTRRAPEVEYPRDRTVPSNPFAPGK